MTILNRFADAFRAFRSGCPCDELRAANKEAEALEGEVQIEIAKFAEVAEQKQKAMDLMAQAMTAKSQAMADKGKAEVQVDILQRDYDQLKTDMAEAERVASEVAQGLQDQYAELSDLYDAALKGTQEATQKCADYQGQLMDVQDSLILLNIQLASCRGENGNLLKTVANFKSALASYKDQCALWAKQVQDLLAKIKTLETQPSSATPPPVFLEEIGCGPITQLFVDTYGIELLGPPTRLKNSDGRYSITTLAEMMRGIQTSGVANDIYVPVTHDCSEFAAKLLAWFMWNSAWANLPMATICHKVPGDYHWRNIFACYDDEVNKRLMLWIVEPQNYTLSPATDVKVSDIDLIMMP